MLALVFSSVTTVWATVTGARGTIFCFALAANFLVTVIGKVKSVPAILEPPANRAKRLVKEPALRGASKMRVKNPTSPDLTVSVDKAVAVSLSIHAEFANQCSHLIGSVGLMVICLGWPFFCQVSVPVFLNPMV